MLGICVENSVPIFSLLKFFLNTLCWPFYANIFLAYYFLLNVFLLSTFCWTVCAEVLGEIFCLNKLCAFVRTTLCWKHFRNIMWFEYLLKISCWPFWAYKFVLTILCWPYVIHMLWFVLKVLQKKRLSRTICVEYFELNIFRCVSTL